MAERVTCQGNKKGHGATRTVGNQEASYQPQRALDKAFVLVGM